MKTFTTERLTAVHGKAFWKGLSKQSKQTQTAHYGVGLRIASAFFS
jgi:hypothetical protein